MMTDRDQVDIYDDVRDFWNRRPCNLRHSDRPVGTREYFDEVERKKYFVEPHIPAFADFERWRDKSVLEIGCGMGTDTIRFARAGARVAAVDYSEESLRIAKQRAEVMGVADRVSFHWANAEELSKHVAPARFDLVYSFGVIHHTPRPDRVVREIEAHFMGPESTLKLMVYNRVSWKTLWAVLTYGKGRFWRWDDVIREHSEAQTGCPVTFTYRRRDIERLLGDGFQIDSIRKDHIFPYRIDEYRRHEYVRVWYFRWLPSGLFRWLERRLGWHLMVDARLRPERTGAA